tara:strand:+ start:1742 stop:2143 length:402 start_codon:yes stop_codon:yes gene_type:complete
VDKRIQKLRKERKMREWIYDSWNCVMNADISPLRNIPDTMVRHMVLQILAWMWCIAFSMIVGSFVVFGISMIAHVVLLAAIAITVGAFEVAEKQPQFFMDKFPHSTPSRARYNMWVDGEKIVLDKDDKGGEHE